ncbi:DNA repair protein RadC [Brevibacillus sp. NPDC003359]|uniref:RadC family protein n=1 Tax=unclassified Brevibacillus TaxID=2684853 RepID=UPI0036D0D9CD
MTINQTPLPDTLLPECELTTEYRTPKSYIDVARESVSFYGAEDCDLQTLIAVILGSSAKPVLCGLLAGIGVHKLSMMSIQEISAIPGMNDATAASLVGAFGLANKLAVRRMVDIQILEPKVVADLLMEEMRHLTQEHFVCLFLNTKNRIIGKKTVFKGSLDAVIVHPREIFKEAIRYSSASIICAHNHPSGSHEPSREDIEMTKSIKTASEMIGIPLLDNLIIGDGTYFSFKEQGYL